MTSSVGFHTELAGRDSGAVGSTCCPQESLQHGLQGKLLQPVLDEGAMGGTISGQKAKPRGWGAPVPSAAGGKAGAAYPGLSAGADALINGLEDGAG